MTSIRATRPTQPPTPPVHWLAGAAAQGGLAGADSIVVPPGTSVAGAWECIARALGVTTSELADRAAPALGAPVADFATADPRALRLLPERLARRCVVFPLAQDDRVITVATANPMDLEAEQAVAFAAGRRVVFRLAPPLAIGEATDASYAPNRSVENLLTSVGGEVADAVRVVEDLAPETVPEAEVQSAPVVRLTNLILRDAVQSGASDAHIEPGPRGGVVRLRIDGVMRAQMQLPLAAITRVVSRIKVLSKLDIADRLRPQDGRARIEVDGRTYDLRVSTVPTRDAEKAVIRVLRPDATRGLEDCDLASSDLTRLRQLLGHREGIVIVTGPTGSGKTTTLYSAIREIATGDINVMTVEDPVEYELPGITQIQVEPKRDVTFASALRAILRQDPDVIFVGEIRDAETAQIAAQAALTGHLVLATLHTNDAIGVVSRLLDLGLDRATIAASLRGAVAQRLVRRVCRECAQPVGTTLTDDEARLQAAYGTTPVARAVGCKSCANTGFRGRLPINEIVPFTPAMCELIATGATPLALHQAALAGGMRTMAECALERVAAGDTTLREVERVLGDAPAAADPEATPAVEGGDAASAASAASAAAAAAVGAVAAVGAAGNPAGGSQSGSATAAVGGSATPAPAAAGPQRVLIVDDDAVLRYLAVAALTAAGFVVEEAEDGDAALRAAGAGRSWDLVVTDLHMPKLDGAGLLRAFRHSPGTANLPIIVLTGSSDQESEIAMMDAGADDYLRKPIDPPRLIARARAVLRRRTL